jgi:ribosomal protein S18 acetylase RimI-like enzyme
LTPSIALRPACPDDEPFLTAMLRLAAGWRTGSAAARLSAADVAYVRGFGRPGDAGLIALCDGAPAGAAWYRLFTRDEGTYGHVADDVPELAIAVRPEARGRGIATLLLDRLLAAAAREGRPGVSLSVEDGNPARRLYDRAGFVVVTSAGGASTMACPAARLARDRAG